MKRLSTGDRVFVSVNYFFLGIIFFLVIAPLLFVIAASFSNADDVILGRVWFWPVNFHLEAYREIFTHNAIMIGYRNSLFYTSVGSFINITLTICAAYPLSRKDLKGRNVIMMMMLFTMYFSGGLIPHFMNIRNLRLIDTVWVMWFPVAISTFNVIIMKTFFQNSIPQELSEAAVLDGCSNIKLLVRVILPLSKAVISVLILFYAVSHWNSFFNALLFLHNRDLFPLQLILREVLIMGRPLDTGAVMTIEDAVTYAEQMRRAELLRYAVIVVASVPLLMVYPFIQKYFTQGIMIGSVKG